MEAETVLALLDKHGYVMGVLYGFSTLTLYQTWVHRDKITYALIDAINEWAALVRGWVQVRNTAFINRIQDKISTVYTQMYLLLILSPVRVSVMRFDYIHAPKNRAPKRLRQFAEQQEREKRRQMERELPEEADSHRADMATYHDELQGYQCTMMHEALSGFQPVKQHWQGVYVGQQLVEYLILETIGNPKGVYVANVDEMPDGDLRDTLQSLDIHSFYSVLIRSHANRVHTLLVTFNRTESLESYEQAPIRLVAANIEKLIFSK